MFRERDIYISRIRDENFESIEFEKKKKREKDSLKDSTIFDFIR